MGVILTRAYSGSGPELDPGVYCVLELNEQ